ncbi:MAG: hypothetical protein RI957_271, partial [Verrucomicrobiota bacterium]
VECVKGIADAAEEFEAPFISGKDSFYNYFETEDGPINIPVTFLCSGIGIVEDQQHVTGSSLRRDHSVLCLLGDTKDEMGGSVFARQHGISGALVPQTDCAKNLQTYRKFHQARTAGLILSAHDVSEGGLITALAEMAFSEKAGVEIDLNDLGGLPPAVALFSESTGRILIEVMPEDLAALQQHFVGENFTVLGKAVAGHRDLTVAHAGKELLRDDLKSLKVIWQQRLAEFY